MSNTWNPVGLPCPSTPVYPAVVHPGHGGYPAPETGPKAIAPGCAPGLPSIDFSEGAWQPYPPSAGG